MEYVEHVAPPRGRLAARIGVPITAIGFAVVLVVLRCPEAFVGGTSGASSSAPVMREQMAVTEWEGPTQLRGRVSEDRSSVEGAVTSYWETSFGAFASFAIAAAVAFTVAVAPVLAASSGTEGIDATGFAEYAKKGGAMGVDPACFVQSCGTETAQCFAGDARCLKGALCLSRCRGDPDCATQCFAEYGNPKLDAWLHCTVETKQCVSVPEGTYDVSKFYAADVPTKAKDFDLETLQGKWYKVRGYNKKYDCYPCQTNSFKYDATSKSMETEVKLRLERKKSGGYWENTLLEKMRIAEPDERSTFVSKGEIFGLSFSEEWYILGGGEDFVVVAYTGNNLQDAYKGAYVYARTPEISSEAEAKAQAVAEKNGYTWNNFCTIDNACPAQAAVDYSKSVTLGMDDLPDLIEWIAPGTTRGGTVNKEGFKGEY